MQSSTIIVPHWEQKIMGTARNWGFAIDYLSLLETVAQEADKSDTSVTLQVNLCRIVYLGIYL